MPAAYQLDAPHRLVRTRVWGILTDEEVRDLYNCIRADPAFESSFQQLCDLRQMTEARVTVETLRDLARSPIFSHGVRRAFVVGRDVDYGLSRLFQAYSEAGGTVIEVFRDWESAEIWLCLVERDERGAGTDGL